MPEHIMALILIMTGAGIAAFSNHIGPDAYQTGTALMAGGLAIYRSPTAKEDKQ